MIARASRVPRGFTLLEALVAMVILSGAGMAVFAWINGSLSAMHRVEDSNLRSQATADIVEFMQSVNPMLKPDGSMDFGSYQIRWHAQPSTDLVDGRDYPQGQGNYQLALYRVRVDAMTEDDARWLSLELTLVGYKRVRSVMGGGVL